QHLGGLLADIRNAQRVDKARQGRALAVFDGLEQLVAGDFRKAFQIDDLLKFQAIQVRRRTDELFVDQLLDGLVAQAFNVHRPSRNIVNDRLLELRAAGQTTHAAIHRAFADGFLALAALDQLRAFDMGAAYRAGLGNLDGASVFRA